MAKSYLHLTSAFPIGLRRNNPGNLGNSAAARAAYMGTTTRPDVGRGPLFLAFENMAFGMLAMSQCVAGYNTNKGLNTIAKMAARYTGEKVNSARWKEWVRDVAKYSGLGANLVLDAGNEAQLKKLCMGIIQKEVGLKWTKGGVTATITSADYDAGQQLKSAMIA